jgi:hypothetical protein
MNTKTTYKAAELSAILELLGTCKNDKDLKNPSSMLTIIRIIKRIQDVIKKHSEEQREILDLLEVPQIENEGKTSYNWSNMDPVIQEKIQASLLELNKTSYEIKGFNSIDEEDFIILTKGMETSAITFLWDYLV